MIDKANVGGAVHEINDTGARGMISPDVFSTAASYAAGDYCIYNNALYKFTAAKSAGAWDTSKVAVTAIASELSALNSSTDQIQMRVRDGIVLTTRTELYNACGKGITFFTTDPNTSDLPAQSSAWRYGTGIIFKRLGGASSTASIILFGYGPNAFAVSSTVESNGNSWTDWEIK